jgi:hypothetical protein
LIIRQATIVNRLREGSFEVPAYLADIAVNIEGARATIQDLGDLEGLAALDEVNATGYHITVARGTLRTGGEATLLFYKSSRAKTIDWNAPDLETRYPPDVTFRQGRWTGRDKLGRH